MDSGDGGIDYDTPNGAFKPFRMEIDHHSDEWDNAPMPYSIFSPKMANTTVVVTGDVPGAKPPPAAIATPKPANGSDSFPRFPAAPDLFSLFH
jgi:hypothetical protein